MFYLCESVAAAANVLSVRKRSGSSKCFICAKAKRQQQSAQSKRKSTTCFGEERQYYNNPSIMERIPNNNKITRSATTRVSDLILLFNAAPSFAPIYAPGIIGIV